MAQVALAWLLHRPVSYLSSAEGRDQPDLEYDFAGKLKVRQKYLSPPGRSNMLYLAPGLSQSPEDHLI